MARRPGPSQHVADILSRMGEDKRGRMMKQLEEHDAQTAEHIKSLMFAFEDLVRVDDRGIQELLRHIDRTDLALALKGATRDIVMRFAQNMSERARALLADEIEHLGEVKVSDVEAARHAILAIAEQLVEAGTIAIDDEGEQYIS